MLARGCSDFQPAQHPCDFLDAGFGIECIDMRDYLAPDPPRAALKMLIRLARDLRQVRHAQSLPVLAEAFQQAPDDFRHAAADTAVALIKYQRGGRGGTRGD